MKGTAVGLMLVLMIGVPLPCTDGTKYMGVSDKLRFTDFTDTPLRNSNFRPERRHTSEKLVMVSDGGKLYAVIQAESNYDPKAISPRGGSRTDAAHTCHRREIQGDQSPRSG